MAPSRKDSEHAMADDLRNCAYDAKADDKAVSFLNEFLIPPPVRFQTVFKLKNKGKTKQRKMPKQNMKPVPKLLSAAVCLRIFIYKGSKITLGSVYRAVRAQSSGSHMWFLANFHIELEQLCRSLTAA